MKYKHLKCGILVLFFALFCSSCSQTENDYQNTVDLRSFGGCHDPKEFYPAFPLRAYNQYNMCLLDDGYPGKKTEAGIVPHPIYGAYIISDFISAYDKSKDDRYLSGAKQLLSASIERMSVVGQTRIFYYQPEWKINDKHGMIYSALTQSRYLNVASRLYSLTKDNTFKQYAKSFFKSLKVPSNASGVMLDCKRIGVILEEYPGEVPTIVLNGWITAVRAILNYYMATGDNDAQELIKQNISALEHLIPFYDIEELANSRYMLTGRTSLRFIFASHNEEGLEFINSCIHFPGFGTYKVWPMSENKWVNHYDKGFSIEKGKAIVLNKICYINVLLSYASYPEENIFQTSIRANESTKVIVELAAGKYNPLHTSVQRENWVRLDTITINKSLNNIMIHIPWDKIQLVAYPTNFAKRSERINCNVYHRHHIAGLFSLNRELVQAGLEASTTLEKYRKKWIAYTNRWPDMDLYKNADIDLRPCLSRHDNSSKLKMAAE